MRRNLIAACLALSALFMFVAAFVVIAADVPETIVIESSLWPNPTKGLVTFSHQKHSTDYKVACTECHHKYENGTNVWKEGDPVKKCDECHTEPTIKREKKLPEDQKKLNLKLAFHNNCVGCHKAYKKEHKGSKPPTSCSKCHPKKKK